jgi:hypothetical protein
VAESEECCDEGSSEGVLGFDELGSELRFVSDGMGGCGDRDGLEACEVEREDGKDEREARGFCNVPLEADGLLVLVLVLLLLKVRDRNGSAVAIVAAAAASAAD